jgi:hypothetical protein
MKYFIYIMSFFVLSLFGQDSYCQIKAPKSTKAKKGRGAGKGTKDKALDSYFYGGSKKGKKGKKEADKKGKKGEKGQLVDTKSLINSKGKKTSGGTNGGSDQATYRPIYVGNKMVTGSINSAQGFRICIYNGSNREEAMAAKLKFMKKYPGMRSYMSYNTPYYKIKVGDFDDKKVVQKALKDITKTFAAAFVVPDAVTVKNIMIYKK